MTTPAYSLVCASNDDQTLQQNLLASDLVPEVDGPHVIRNAASAAEAYNRGLAQSDAPIVIFAHQDVYFPPNWLRRLSQAIEWLDKHDPNWAVLAPFGMSGATHCGTVYSTSLSAVVGRPVPEPKPVDSVDELVIVLRRSSGLSFDEALPDWHMYGTDIVQSAREKGLGAWVAPLPLVHNDQFHGYLGEGFRKSYHAVLDKWRDNLPIRTSVLWIHRHGLDLSLYRLKSLRSYNGRKRRAGDTSTDPRIISAACGWEVSQ